MSGPSIMRTIVLHADDFGMNAAVTDGIIDGFASGLLTSTSLLTNAPAAGLAVTAWRRLDSQRKHGTLRSLPLRKRLGDDGYPFDLGVHLNLTQGRPLSGPAYPDELVDEAGLFLSPGRLFKALIAGGRRWRQSIEQELTAQIVWLLDHRLQPTHLNGHQYVEMMPVIAELLPLLAGRFSIGYVRSACEPGHWRTSFWPGLRIAKCGVSFVKQFYSARFRRRLRRAGLDTANAYFGTSHAALIDRRTLDRFLRFAGDCRKIEVGMHPARHDTVRENVADGWVDPLAEHRPAELDLLSSNDLAGLFSMHGVRLGRLNSNERERLAA